MRANDPFLSVSWQHKKVYGGQSRIRNVHWVPFAPTSLPVSAIVSFYVVLDAMYTRCDQIQRCASGNRRDGIHHLYMHAPEFACFAPKVSINVVVTPLSMWAFISMRVDDPTHLFGRPSSLCRWANAMTTAT